MRLRQIISRLTMRTFGGERFMQNELFITFFSLKCLSSPVRYNIYTYRYRLTFKKTIILSITRCL